MKILLLTDMPPCKNFTAGLVLHELVKSLPANSIACYAVTNPTLNAKLDPELSIPIQYADKPSELSFRIFPGSIGTVSSYLKESLTANHHIPKLLKDIKKFVKEQNISKVWCVLQGQTMFRLAVQLVKELKLPLYTQVWDPPGWWLRANSIDKFSSKSILNTFDEAQKLSTACAAASWAMADYYHHKYDINAIPVVPGIDKSISLPPAKKLNDRDTVIIGMAGQLYSYTEWAMLLATLEYCHWNIANKKIKIRFLGRSFYAPANSAHNIEYLGWRNQAETIQLLGDCDMLYCPYWFDKAYEQEARFSFPSKLTSYLAAGRPVIFHGPRYASPATFLKSYDAGLLCHELEKLCIYNSIRRLILDEELYGSITFNGHKAFQENLTLDVMRNQFYKFLGLTNQMIEVAA